MAQRRTIADFNLVRNTTASFMDLRLQFVHSHIGETTSGDWRFCGIRDPANSDLRFTYAVCVSKGLFVLFEAHLANGRDLSDKLYRRYTDMHFWELLIDCWLDVAKGTTNSLRWVGIHDIINADVQKLIRREIECQFSTDGMPWMGQVLVGPSSITWTENYLTRAVERAAGALNKRVVSTTHMSADTRGAKRRSPKGLDLDTMFLEFNMILELENLTVL